jgi:hypothetical protein
VTFYLPFQAPFDSSGIRFAQAKNKKYISRERRARRKSGFYFPPGNQSPNLSFLGQSYQRATKPPARVFSLSSPPLENRYAPKLAENARREHKSRVRPIRVKRKRGTWVRTTHILSHAAESPLSAAINILICTGPSAAGDWKSDVSGEKRTTWWMAAVAASGDFSYAEKGAHDLPVVEINFWDALPAWNNKRRLASRGALFYHVESNMLQRHTHFLAWFGRRL